MTPPTFPPLTRYDPRDPHGRHDAQPRKRRLHKGLIGVLGSGLVVVILVAAIVMTLQFAHGARSAVPTHSPQTASGPATTATVDQTAVASTTASTTGTVTSGSGNGSAPTPTVGVQRNDVQVTQNQNFNPTCTNDSPVKWTVQLTNTGAMTVSWHVTLPLLPGQDRPWGTTSPSSGSLGPGQSGSFEMTGLDGLMPCGSSNTEKASVHLIYPAGSWQPDLPLTYFGVGPIPESHVVLTSGSLTNAEACPASGTAPAPFTFAIMNIGTAIGWTNISIKDRISETNLNLWANVASASYNPPQNPAITTGLTPNETETVTIAPLAGVLCDGTVYHMYLQINDQRMPSQTMTFTYTFG